MNVVLNLINVKVVENKEYKKENIDKWKPYGLVYGSKAYTNGKRNKFYYKKSWFCEENSIIHSSEKSVLNCKYCSEKYYKPNE